MAAQHWLDSLTGGIAPRWTLKRQRARLAGELLKRHYESAAVGRRTSGWRQSSDDANAAVGSGLTRLRIQARDLVRNNPFATAALDTIVDDTVGWGIVAKPDRAASKASRDRVAKLWASWAYSTACDADGQRDLAGLEKLVMRTIVEAGEALVRRRIRRPEDGLPIPMQLQVLEPDFLDESKDGLTTEGGGRIIQGVEFDAIGRRVAYWLFREHPGASSVGIRGFGFGASERIPASSVLHVYKPGRPGQVRGPSWFAPVLLRLKDFDEYEDAALMKQKIAACLAVITSDADGSAPAVGTTTTDRPEVDSLEPGMILNVPPGRDITTVQPPAVNEHEAYSRTVLRAIAAGLGVGYEDITGDYVGMPFSAARMSRLRKWARVEDWRWRLLIPQFCDPVWRWAMQVAGIMGLEDQLAAEWTAPPMAMIEPDKEGLAHSRNIRAGITTLPEVIRERGYDPDDLLEEYAEFNRKLDAMGLILDSDPRKTTQAGQPRESGKAAESTDTQNLRAITATLDDIVSRLAERANGVHHR